MRYRVFIDEDALAAIRQTARFIAVERQSPLTCERWLDRLWTAIDDLEQMPRRCPVDPVQTALNDRETRKMVFGNYMVFYQIDEGAQRIDVVGFIHGSRRRKS